MVERANTAFFKAYGQKVEAVGGAGTFSLFFPLLMVILAVLQACGIYNRILRCTGLSWLAFDTDVVLDECVLSPNPPSLHPYRPTDGRTD